MNYSEFVEYSASETNQPLPRDQQEKHWRYYSQVISLTLSALDDGSLSKAPGRDYIEYVISSLGFDVTDWTRLPDETLIRHNTIAARINESIAKDRSLAEIRKQRQRLNEWQALAGNPIIIEHRLFFDQQIRQHYSEYRIPIGRLLRRIITQCPPGTRKGNLKATIKRLAIDYIRQYRGAANVHIKRRSHSPSSDYRRAATLAGKAFLREMISSGEQSAINEFRATFQAEIKPDLLHRVFAPAINEINGLIAKKGDVTNTTHPYCPQCPHCIGVNLDFAVDTNDPENSPKNDRDTARAAAKYDTLLSIEDVTKNPALRPAGQMAEAANQSPCDPDDPDPDDQDHRGFQAPVSGDGPVAENCEEHDSALFAEEVGE